MYLLFKVLLQYPDSLIKHYPTIIYSIVQNLFTLLINPISSKLTHFERPITKNQFEENFVWKMFTFHFIINFTALFYILFWEQNLPKLRNLLGFQLIIGALLNNFSEVGKLCLFIYFHYFFNFMLNFKGIPYIKSTKIFKKVMKLISSKLSKKKEKIEKKHSVQDGQELRNRMGTVDGESENDSDDEVEEDRARWKYKHIVKNELGTLISLFNITIL